jgi:predicted Zn-dependent protease
MHYQNGNIEIYYFKTSEDLAGIIKHELGHGLGLGHSSDPKSIMSPTASGLFASWNDKKITAADLKI